MDSGVSWSTDTCLTSGSGDSETPFIGLSDSIVHVVWVDNRDGNHEIYYKRNPDGNLPVGIKDDPGAKAGQQIVIYPNPASYNIHVVIKKYSNGKTLLYITNIFGKQLLSKQILDNETIIDVSGLSTGFYFVNLGTDFNQFNTTKLIISK